MSDGSPIDAILESAMDQVVRKTVKERRGYWTPTEVMTVAQSHPLLKHIIPDLAKRYGSTLPGGPWHFDKIVLTYMKGKIGELHRVRDSVTGLRVYESVKVPGQSERRFMLLTTMTAENLLSAMEQTRTQERSQHLKGEGYHILLEEVQKLGSGATVADALPTALPRIMAFRVKSA